MMSESNDNGLLRTPFFSSLEKWIGSPGCEYPMVNRSLRWGGTKSCGRPSSKLRNRYAITIIISAYATLEIGQFLIHRQYWDQRHTFDQYTFGIPWKMCRGTDRGPWILAVTSDGD